MGDVFVCCSDTIVPRDQGETSAHSAVFSTFAGGLRSNKGGGGYTAQETFPPAIIGLVGIKEGI